MAQYCLLMNICNIFQPQSTEDADEGDYDSADSAVSDLSETEDEDDDNIFDGTSAAQKEKRKNKERENVEHSNPNSYSWCVLRLAVMKIVQCQLQDFLNVAGIELQGKRYI